MSEAKRQHPIAAITNVLKTLRELLLPIIIVAVIGGTGQSGFFMHPSFIGYFLFFLLIYSVVMWWRYTYRIEGDELRIEYGVIVRKKSFIPRHRIQVINISSGILQRMFGLVSLNVQTAGGDTTGVTINALTREEAEWIKETLSKHGLSGSNTIDGQEDVSFPEYNLSWKNLIIAGTTSGSFGIALSIVGTITSQIHGIVDEDVLLDFIEDFFQSDITFFIILAITLIFFSWILSIIGTILAHANFRITAKAKELIISRGLFEKRQISIPYSRIQAIRVQEGVFRQPFGYCSLYIESAGFGEQSGQSTVMYPLLRKKDVPTFLMEILPDYLRETDRHRPPIKALRRYMIRTMIPILFLAGALLWLSIFGLYTLLLLPFGAFLGYLRFRAAAIGKDDDTMTITYRNLAKTTAIIKRHRIQSGLAHDNWFQRRLGLKSLTVTVASSNTGATFTAADFDEGLVLDLLEWVEPDYLAKKNAQTIDKPEQEQ